MMCLDNVQDTFSRAIYYADTQPLECLIEGSDNFTCQARINVYRNNTMGTLKNALSQVFPVCELLVGANYFNQLATTHVRHNPSIQRNLDLYGGTFPVTIKGLIEEHQELEKLDYLADVAQLEWLLHQSYYAVDRSPFDMDKFAALDAEQQAQASFILAQDIALMDSEYPVYDIWTGHQAEGNNMLDDSHNKRHNYILVQRKKWQSLPELIDVGLYRLLMAISKGIGLLDLTHYLEQSPLDIATLIQQGLVNGFEDGIR